MARVWTDEDHLAWVKLRVAKVTVTRIAEQYGTSSEYVTACTNRIKTADIKESGENPKLVKGAYW